MGQRYMMVNLSRKQFLSPQAFGDDGKLRALMHTGAGSMAALMLLLLSDRAKAALGTTRPLIGQWAGDRVMMTGDQAATQASGAAHLEASFCTSAGAHDNLFHVASVLYDDISDNLKRAAYGLQGHALPPHWHPGAATEQTAHSQATWDEFEVALKECGQGPALVIYNATTHEYLDPARLPLVDDFFQRGGRGLYSWLHNGNGPTTLLALLLSDGNTGRQGRGGNIPERPDVGRWAGHCLSVMLANDLPLSAFDVTARTINALDLGHVQNADYWQAARAMN